MTSKITTTQPDDWVAAFRVQAQQDGQTLSEWVGACCLANLPKSVRRGLSERPGAHRPKQRNEGEES